MRPAPLFALLLAACLLGGRAALAVPELPERFRAGYVLSASGATVGRTTWTLAPSGEGRYRYESRSRTAGFVSLFRDDRIVELSELEVVGDRLRPLAYRYARTGKKPREVSIDFDWANGTAHNTARGETWHMPIPPGTLDKLSYVLALMQGLARGDRSLALPIADGGKLKTYRLEAAGEATVDTPLGALATVEVRRVREDSARETTIWCAPALGYLPVRVEHREDDGESISLLIDSVQGIAPPGPRSAAR